MTLVRLFPHFEVFYGTSIEDQSWIIARAFGICSGWRVNFAIDESGASVGASGSSHEISTELDRKLLGKLRSQADVIVTSGKTARAERYKSSKHAPIAIFTQSGDLGDVPAVQGTQYFTPLVLTPNSSLARVEDSLDDVDARILTFDEQDKSAPWSNQISGLLHQQGFQSPILESGIQTLRTFITDGVVDEICLTIASHGSRGLSSRDVAPYRFAEIFGAGLNFRLADLFSDGHTIFTRWVRNGVAAA